MFYIENLLTPKEVQKKLGLGRNNTYKLISKKGFPKVQIGKRYFIIEDKLEQYILEHNKSQINL